MPISTRQYYSRLYVLRNVYSEVLDIKGIYSFLWYVHNIIKAGKNVSAGYVLVGTGCRKYVACEEFIKIMFNKFDKILLSIFRL